MKPAPQGLGSLAWRYAIVVAIVAALGFGAFVMLNSGAGQVPVSTLLPSAGATLQPTVAAPAITIRPITPAPTVSISLPPPVVFAPYEIPGDVKVSSCNHIYTVVFTITDSNGQSAIYEGKTATFQLLDGEAPRTATIGAGGKLEATVNETFQKTGSGCFSRLQPKVLTVDGRPAF